MTGRQRGLTLAAAAWFLVVAWCTLRPDPAAVARVAVLPWYCLACGDGGITDVLLNLLLFMPFGVVARAAGWRLGRTLLVLCLFSIAIECTQGFLLVGRDASLGDVLCNTIGGGISWLALPLLVVVVRPSRRFALTAATGILVLSTAIWFASGYAMHPSISGPPPWYGQWNHAWPAHELFQGSIQNATLEGLVAPNDSMDHPPQQPDSVDLMLEVTRTVDSVPLLPVSIFRLVDSNQRVVIAVAQRHTDLRLEVRMQSDRLGLRTPEWTFPNSANVTVAEPWRFRWQWHADRVELSSGPVSGTTPATRVSIPFSIGLGWVMLHPFVSSVDQNAPLWTALWLIWWFGLLGWFAGAAGAWWAGIYAIAGAASFIGISALFALPVHARELQVAMLGFLIFAVFGRRWSTG